MPAFRRDLGNLPGYVPGKPIEEVARELGVTDIVKMASNECPTSPFPEVQAVIADAARLVNRYPDTVARDLSCDIADLHGVRCENVMVGPGSSSLLVSVALAMGGQDTTAVFADPSFLMYRVGTAYAGSRPIAVPLTPNLRHDVAAMIAAVRPDTTVMYVCNPNNPTGTHVAAEAVAEIVETVPDHVLIVIDEAYEEYITAADHATAIPRAVERDNVIVMRTFSKVYGLAGLRVGYAIGAAETVGSLRRLQLPFATTTLSLAAAREALRHQDRVAERAKENAAGREQLLNGLRALGVVCYDSQTNFVWTGPDTAAADNVAGLLRAGVIVRHFGDYIRVSVGTEPENGRFLETWSEIMNG